MAMFDSTKKVAAPKGKAKAAKTQVETAGLEHYAAIVAAEKALGALKTTTGEAIKSQMFDQFVEMGVAKGGRPDSYTGVEGSATASLELRARSSTSALSSDEVELLTEKGIPTQEIVATVETFIINPAYAEDASLLQKIEKALKSVKGIPEDLFLKQDGTSKTVLAEGALDAVFKHDADTIADLLPVTSVLAIKPTLATDDLGEALKLITNVIGEDA